MTDKEVLLQAKEEAPLDINETLNELLVKLFRSINAIEEQAIRTEEYKDMTTNDMHVIEAIGTGAARNMTSVAKALAVTTGTLTISVNSLVKKGYVDRVRSEEDRRVVLISLTAKGTPGTGACFPLLCRTGAVFIIAVRTILRIICRIHNGSGNNPGASQAFCHFLFRTSL